MNRTEFIIWATTLLFGAFCIGWVAMWLVNRLRGNGPIGIEEMKRMSHELLSAEESRDEALEYVQKREGELVRQIAQIEAELHATMDGLRAARQENAELRTHLERAGAI